MRQLERVAAAAADRLSRSLADPRVRLRQRSRAPFRTEAASSRRSSRRRRQGKVRYVGFTGHKDPEIHLRMLSYEFPVRRLPAAAERLRRRLPQLSDAGAAGAGAAAASRAIGMKSLGGDGRVVKKKAARVDDALRYAMSLPVCTTVCGIDSLKVLRQNLRIARGFSPMSARERKAYERQPRRAARWTGDSSSTRRPPSTRARSAASSTASRRRKRSRSDRQQPRICGRLT